MRGNRMKKMKILVLFVFLTTLSYGQSGYLGAVNAFEFKVNMGPSRHRTNKIIEEAGDSVLSNGLRLVYPSLQLNYSRTVARNIELSAGVEYSRMRLLTNGTGAVTINGSSYNALNDLRANKIGGVFEFRYYRKGSFSPIGKFIGFSLNFSRATLGKNQELLFGNTGSQLSSSNFISRKYDITSIYAPLTEFTKKTAKSSSLRFVMGRNYPLNRNLTLSASVSIPLLSYYRTGLAGTPGFALLSDDDYIRITNGDLEETMKNSLHKYNRIMLNFGIKYHL